MIYKFFADLNLRRQIYSEIVGSTKYEYICEAMPSAGLIDFAWRISRNQYDVSTGDEVYVATHLPVNRISKGGFNKASCDFIFQATDIATVKAYDYFENTYADTTEAQNDANALTFADFDGSNTDIDNVTVALGVLPAVGETSPDSVITWASSDADVISDDGQTVVRPLTQDGNEVVTMTATITNGLSVVTKDFVLTVLAMTEVTEDAAELTFADFDGTNVDANSITTALGVLPAVGETNSSDITWDSDKPLVISPDGQTVVRPALGQYPEVVTMTATLTKDSSFTTKDFVLTVLAETA